MWTEKILRLHLRLVYDVVLGHLQGHLVNLSQREVSRTSAVHVPQYSGRRNGNITSFLRIYIRFTDDVITLN